MTQAILLYHKLAIANFVCDEPYPNRKGAIGI